MGRVRRCLAQFRIVFAASLGRVRDMFESPNGHTELIIDGPKNLAERHGTGE